MKPSKTTLVALTTVLLVVAVFAMVMAFRAPGRPAAPQRPVRDDPNDSRNGAIIDGVLSIQMALQSWVADHANLYPAADEVVPGGAFAGYVQSWPNNAVTGQPMAPGHGPGDYTYERLNGGMEFRLTAYGVDGSPVITVP